MSCCAALCHAVSTVMLALSHAAGTRCRSKKATASIKSCSNACQSMPTSRAAGVLQPLVVGQPDFRPRIRQLMEAMGLDLLQRVREDSAEEAGR